MPLIFITGISTSGKSTVAKELSGRGYEAYDTEHNGISAWYSKKTGAYAAGFNEMPERTEAWLNQHEWLISLDRVAEFAKEAVHKPIFLCGGSANETAVSAMCQRVIWLQTNEQTIRKRVLNPRDHDYGTRPHELALAIEGNRLKEAEYRKIGATMVDATQPIEDVINDILAIVLPGQHTPNRSA